MKSGFLLLGILLIHQVVLSQNDSIQRIHAERISIRMKDSLILSESQFNKIFQFTLWIAKEKNLIWQQYAGLDSLRIYLQRIENKRDSLYMQALNEDEKYGRYIEKKNWLISAY